ncbi:hypothetical protein PV02_11370 [Methanolobus chelungpuianus]|uniref:Uncharacterized protein n=1 Tax=Methanolobus chelungpuianus TaxID=502115 RepID=A0AAE3KYF6_9EURY|nr:hypothetical protein [Methanolobus chelungpuianus]
MQLTAVSQLVPVSTGDIHETNGAANAKRGNVITAKTTTAVYTTFLIRTIGQYLENKYISFRVSAMDIKEEPNRMPI